MAIAHILLISTYIVYGNSLFGRDMTRLQSPKRDVTWLHSRRVTPWGKFGPKDLCPINSFITGMRLKIEPKHKGDNSALNAIQLLCTSMYGEEVKNITSATGRFGRYGKIKYCPRGLATGYQLRSQTGQGNARDDVAAVDFKLICSDLNNALSYVTQDDVRSLPWGDWTNKQRCPSKTAVCGISTQVEELGKNLRREDETTLNNVDIACCPTSEPIKNCELKYHWETIRCPTEVVYCKIELTIGIKEDEQLSKFRKFYYKLGNVGEFNEFVLRSFKVQAKNYEEKIFSNYSMKQIISKIDVNRKNSSINVKCEGIVQQFVVTCDLIKLYTYENRCVPDQYAEKEWEKKGLYFRTNSPFKTILWSYNCDFMGRNKAVRRSNIADCGYMCLSDLECTHFVWNKYNGGTCWMKVFTTSESPVEKYGENFLCGWIETRKRITLN